MKLTIEISPTILAYLRQLAGTGFYGPAGTAEEVAAQFVMKGIRGKCRGSDGFLRSPPKTRKGKE